MPYKRQLADSFLYFAYGSNLLKERINVQIKEALFVGNGVLEGYRLTFFDFGARWEGAVGSVEAADDDQACGVVWEVPESFSKELDIQEAQYERLEVPIKMLTSDETFHCRTYIYLQPNRQYQPPSPHYKHIIVEGAVEHCLPQPYIAKLRAIPHNGYKGQVRVPLKIFETLELPKD